MIFASPPEDDIDWADALAEAMVEFLGRAWRIADDVAAAGSSRPGGELGDMALRRVTHHTIADVTRLVEVLG